MRTASMGLRWLDAEQARRLAIFHTAPELPLGRDNEVLVKRIGVGRDLHPLAAAGDDREDRALAATTHILCCSWGLCFSAAPSSENDQGSMNLASNTAPLLSTRPSRVAAIQRSAGCKILALDIGDDLTVLASYQRRLSSSVATPSWTMRLPDRSSGSTSPRFLPPEPQQGGLVIAQDDPGIRAADKVSALGRFEPRTHVDPPRHSVGSTLNAASDVGCEVGKQGIDMSKIKPAWDVLRSVVED